MQTITDQLIIQYPESSWSPHKVIYEGVVIDLQTLQELSVFWSQYGIS